MKYHYYAIFEKDEDGYSISFPDLPGCLTCAKDIEEALKMSKDVNKLSKLFEKKFDDLDSLLERKVEKLSEYTNIENITQKSIEENKAKLDWLKALQSKLDNVVKI